MEAGTIRGLWGSGVIGSSRMSAATPGVTISYGGNGTLRMTTGFDLIRDLIWAYLDWAGAAHRGRGFARALLEDLIEGVAIGLNDGMHFMQLRLGG